MVTVVTVGTATKTAMEMAMEMETVEALETDLNQKQILMDRLLEITLHKHRLMNDKD